jgi:S1-C subfamily serine protease
MTPIRSPSASSRTPSRHSKASAPCRSPSNSLRFATIARIVPQIIKTGRAEQIGLGIGIDPMQRLERRIGLRGVIVLSVPEGSAAAKAGLKGITQTNRGIILGDVIVKVDDKDVRDFDALYGILDAHKPGDSRGIRSRSASPAMASRRPSE